MGMEDATLAISTMLAIGFDDKSSVVSVERSAIDRGREVRELSRSIKAEIPLDAMIGTREERAFASRESAERDKDGPEHSDIFLRARSMLLGGNRKWKGGGG